jgi:hypothetical protein
MWDEILEAVTNWLSEIWEIIKKDPKVIIWILILPILINAMAKAILDFSLLAMIGYYVACIYGFSKILEDPYRTIKWGVGYVIGAVAIKMIFENMIPAYDSSNAISIISVIIIGYVILMFYLKARELKNS